MELNQLMRRFSLGGLERRQLDWPEPEERKTDE